MSSKKPLKVTDKRRQQKGGAKGPEGPKDTNGAGPALADIFSDRRTYQNGRGKKAS